jgi:hypothetical protein
LTLATRLTLLLPDAALLPGDVALWATRSRENGWMLAISRFRYDDDPTAGGSRELGLCLDRLGAQPGFVGGVVGRALDDPTLWVLQTRWENVGSYRRALSAYEIRMTVVPLLADALDEPSAYEIIAGDGATEPNEARSRLG